MPSTTKNYRPMDILEYVQEVLSSEGVRKRMRDKQAEQGLPEVTESE